MGRSFDGIHRTTFVIDENGMIERIFYKSENEGTYRTNFRILPIKR